jgi:NitT/TauT family transport system permease protein
MIRMAQAFHATRFAIFRKIQLPHAMPYIFSGLKISVTFAVIGVVVAEFVTAQEGLGYLIVFSEGNLDTPMMMGSLVVLSAVGVLLYSAVVRLEKLCIWWEPVR